MNSQQTLSHPAGGSRLLAAVLQQALADLQGQDKSLQADASQFFTSPWYQHICQTLDLLECQQVSNSMPSPSA